MDGPIFNLDNLGDMDRGVVRVIIDEAIGQAVADCDARPALDKTRTVEIKIVFKPSVSEGGAMVGVKATVGVAVKIPGRVTLDEFLPTSVNGETVTAHLSAERPQPLFTPTKDGN